MGAVLPLGPYARLDANAVARRNGKTRGAITNLFGSQSAYQAATMLLTNEQPDVGGIRDVDYPAPSEFASADEWIARIADIESARGPHHRVAPSPGYATRWTLWLSQLPYAIWSDVIATPSAQEFAAWVELVDERLVQPALAHFELEPIPPLRPIDLALALANLIEGLWLAQLVCDEHPLAEPVAVGVAARNALTMIWRGGTRSSAAVTT